MGRPKGSVNKKKTVVKKVERAVDKSVDNVPRGTLCLCDHEEDMHYGDVKNYCNTSGCGCLEFREK